MNIKSFVHILPLSICINSKILSNSQILDITFRSKEQIVCKINRLMEKKNCKSHNK